MPHIYFAKCGQHIKVGTANNVEKRLSNLRVGSAAPIDLLATVVGDRYMEKLLHKRLSDHHVQGEWFRDCPEVRAVINESIETGDIGEPFTPLNRGSKFGPVCKLLWPFKTAAHLAAIGKKDERTAKRWLSGEYDPPADVALAVFAEILKRG